MLDLALVLALSRTCAPQVAPQTLAAVAYAESRFDPLAIGVNRGPGPVRRARSPHDAAALARNLLDRGANLDLGLAQINSANLGWLGLSVEDAFEPCRNLAAAGTVLAAGYRMTGSGPEARRFALRSALSRYNTGHPERGLHNGYVARVERAAADLGLTDPGPAPAPPQQSALALVAGPILPPEPARPAAAWDVFARASVSMTLTFRPNIPPTEISQ